MATLTNTPFLYQFVMIRNRNWHKCDNECCIVCTFLVFIWK